MTAHHHHSMIMKPHEKDEIEKKRKGRMTTRKARREVDASDQLHDRLANGFAHNGVRMLCPIRGSVKLGFEGDP